MNKKSLILIVVIIGLLISTGVILITRNKDKNTNKVNTPNSSQSCENKNVINHQVIIENDKVTPQTTSGKLCDTITITNKDNKDREIAFGQHSNHITYDGISEETVGKDKSLKITLNKTGDYLFHDHDQDEVKGDFIVSAN